MEQTAGDIVGVRPVGEQAVVPDAVEAACGLAATVADLKLLGGRAPVVP